MSTRLETNFTRLLHRCETMASDKQHGDWRFEKYVGALQDYLSQLRKTASCPPAEILKEYTKKVDFLKGILEAEKLPSSTAKAVAADLFTPSSNGMETSAVTRGLHMQTKARYHTDMRDELLSSDADSQLRLRKTPTSPGAASKNAEASEDFDTIIKHHQEVQEKLAEEMLHLAQNMKENAKTAGKIVQEDNQRLAESNKVADSNYAKLKVESERLETHVQKSCNWWVWIMLVMVCATFIWMILFMRMFPKR